VPWETLYDKKHRFHVTTSQNTPFVRAVDDDCAPKRLSTGRPIRILGMAARVKVLNGIALDQIEVDAEQVAIKNALGDLDDGIRAKLSWIPSAKVRDLNQRFLRGDAGQRWDIFHFIGHGGHDAEKGMGFIVVQEQRGSRGERLYADDLRACLTQPGQTPSLVILNSCSGAQGEPGSLFSSTAAELIHGGVAAVIAMQFEISDNMGVAFAETFYSYLVEKISIQAALTHTRLDLKARQFGEWISPVLYMRGLDGEIFVESGAA
jgi:CHAT domain-containing protein